jgi:hypothetical protein
MPTRRLYDIRISNKYTQETADYKAADLCDCADTINKHFGCLMITKNGVVNLMCRGIEGSPPRFRGIRIFSKKP